MKTYKIEISETQREIILAALLPELGTADAERREAVASLVDLLQPNALEERARCFFGGVVPSFFTEEGFSDSEMQK